MSEVMLHNFADRYRAYKPKVSTLANPEILEQLKNDSESYRSIGDYIESECDVFSKIDSTILVVGSGSGGLTEYFAKKYNQLHIIDLDIAYPSLKFIKNTTQESLRHDIVCADASAIPLTNSSVDAVIAHGVFRYIKQPGAALTEIDRVLKPGGKAFISEGKDIANMGNNYIELINIPTEIQTTPIPFLIENVSMPRLTLFYALYENRLTDPDVAEEIIQFQNRHHQTNQIEAIFSIAGKSIDNIYGFQWTKEDSEYLSSQGILFQSLINFDFSQLDYS